MIKTLLTSSLFLTYLLSFSQDSLVVIHNNGNTMALRNKPDIDAHMVWECESGDSVYILKGDVNDYVMIRRHNSIEVGYIHQIFFTSDRKATEIINKSARNKLTYAPLSSSASKPKRKASPSSSGSSSKTIQTGPRGGRYYINSKGNKVYVK